MFDSTDPTVTGPTLASCQVCNIAHLPCLDSLATHFPILAIERYATGYLVLSIHVLLTQVGQAGHMPVTIEDCRLARQVGQVGQVGPS